MEEDLTDTHGGPSQGSSQGQQDFPNMVIAQNDNDNQIREQNNS